MFDPKVKPGARFIEVGGRIQAKYEIRRNDLFPYFGARTHSRRKYLHRLVYVSFKQLLYSGRQAWGHSSLMPYIGL